MSFCMPCVADDDRRLVWLTQSSRVGELDISVPGVRISQPKWALATSRSEAISTIRPAGDRPCALPAPSASRASATSVPAAALGRRPVWRARHALVSGTVLVVRVYHD